MSFTLPFLFSDKQKMLSEALVSNFINNKNTLVFAVTGSGKTEICFPVIDFLIQNNYKFAFSSPRRIICDSIFYRLKNSFPSLNIQLSYGGLSSVQSPQFLVCTCHKLQNYKNYFDLIIIDEIDAYPLQGNETFLKNVLHSVKRNFILLTATPTLENIKLLNMYGGTMLNLHQRFHKEQLPLPKIHSLNFPILLYSLKRELSNKRKCIVFVPTINDVFKMKNKLSFFYKNVDSISSKSKNQKEIIRNFSQDDYSKIIVSTTILERGITFPKVAIFVWNTAHHVYTKETLIQIAGRSGRSWVDKIGAVYFLGDKRKNKIKQVVKEIKHLNNELYNLQH